MLFGNQFLFGTNGDEIQGVSFLGIPLIVLITDLIASILLIMFGSKYLHLQEEV
jgi:hypothetical protein